VIVLLSPLRSNLEGSNARVTVCCVFRSFHVAGLSILLAFAKFEMSFLACLVLAGLLCASLSATALGESDRWPRCRGADPDAMIVGCTEIIARGSRETKRNQIVAYINRSAASRAKGDVDRAIADLDKALQLNPKSPLALTKRASAYHAKGDLDRAIADYNAAIAAQPKSAAAFYGRSEAYRAKKDLDRAIRDYDRALRLDKDLAAAYGGRAMAYRDKGKLDKALADFDEAVRLDPSSASLRVERGATYQTKGNLDQAIGDYDQAIERDPKLPLAYNNRGLAFSAKGEFDKAIADFSEAIELDPEFADAFLNRANAYRSKHDLERARQDLEAALKLDPQHDSAQEALDEVNRLIAESTAPPTHPAAGAPAKPDSLTSHSLPLITTLATALGLALMLGFFAVLIKLPALVGYLLAGILIGPFTPGFVGDAEIARELAEIGVMLLMFGVGLHFSLDDLLEVQKIAVPGAVLQIAVATALGVSVAATWGWGLGGSLVFGLALSVASTVVLLRALEARGALESMNGRIAVGWLVVEDLAMVLVLVMLPPLAGWLGGNTPGSKEGSLWQTLGVTLAEVSAFIVLMLVVGRQVFPKLLWQVARTGSRELFTLCVVAAAVSIAYAAAKLFGVSFALGAFFAGTVMRESEFSHRAAEESLPLREAFAVLFFVSVGMLFDPMVLVAQPLRSLAVVGIIVVGKSIAAAALVLAFRYPLTTALTVSASLAQIGEFSFILAGLGVSLGLLPVEGQNLILAGALISIAINPLLFATVEPLLVWIRSRSALARKFERHVDPLAELPMATDEKYLSGQVVLVGYGRVGRRIGECLAKQDIPYVVAEQNRELVERLRASGIAAVSGDASDPPY
jgi:monovalent cation:H+ antiporter-2, CPA2 family